MVHGRPTSSIRSIPGAERRARVPLALVALALGGACAKVNTAAGGSGGVTGSGAGTGSLGSGGNGTASGTGGTTIIDRSDASLIQADVSTTCADVNYTFAPKIPTVFMLVDQSGSMFGCRTQGGALDSTGRQCANQADTSWYPLRDGVLTVANQLQGQVRFGFTAFTGEMSDAVCPVLAPVPPALNNYSAISTQYNALVAPKKGETPTKNALAQVQALLTADTSPGDKFILLVTDGQPDYCDDGNNLCPPDSVVGELQTLEAAGLKTLVFGISSPLTTISDAVLQAFANAGAGQPVAPPGTTNLFDFYDQCNGAVGNGNNGWKMDFAATGKPAQRGQTIGNYSTTGGTETVYKPDVTNQTALVNLFSAALSGVKSCVFDLSDINGKAITVDLTQLDEAQVSIMGTTVPLDNTNGWRMNTSTQLELVGAACDTWHDPANTLINFQFPCQIFIIP